MGGGEKSLSRQLIGAIKDKVSTSKAAVTSAPTLHRAVLRATSHTPYATHHHISTLLSLGDGPRATASVVVASLADRLRRTGDSTVALKCLLTVHHIVRFGPFILQDQVSTFPRFPGRNCLNLSSFSDPATIVLSRWVRWYARYLETLLLTTRQLGFVLTTSRDIERNSVSSYLNEDLIRDVDSLAGLMEEMCKVPDDHGCCEDSLLWDIRSLLRNEFLSAADAIWMRLGEFKERLSCMSFGDSVELACGLKRLEVCKEGLRSVFDVDNYEPLWELVGELKGRVGMGVEGRRVVKFGNVSESARYEGRVVMGADSVTFSSRRRKSENYTYLGKCGNVRESARYEGRVMTGADSVDFSLRRKSENYTYLGKCGNVSESARYEDRVTTGADSVDFSSRRRKSENYTYLALL